MVAEATKKRQNFRTNQAQILTMTACLLLRAKAKNPAKKQSPKSPCDIIPCLFFFCLIAKDDNVKIVIIKELFKVVIFQFNKNLIF